MAGRAARARQAYQESQGRTFVTHKPGESVADAKKAKRAADAAKYARKPAHNNTTRSTTRSNYKRITRCGACDMQMRDRTDFIGARKHTGRWICEACAGDMS